MTCGLRRLWTSLEAFWQRGKPASKSRNAQLDSTSVRNPAFPIRLQIFRNIRMLWKPWFQRCLGHRIFFWHKKTPSQPNFVGVWCHWFSMFGESILPISCQDWRANCAAFVLRVPDWCGLISDGKIHYP